MQKLFKNMKEHWIGCFFIILIAFLFLGFIYQDNTLQAHDLSFHLANIQNLLQNHLKVSFIMPNIGNHLGYGLYIFYPFLPHLVYASVAKVFSFFSVSLIDSLLFCNILVTICSSIILYSLSFRLSKSKKIAFFSAIIYMLFPYRLGTITVRMALNENFASLFMPLILLSFTYLLQDSPNKNFFLLFFVVGYCGLIFSHFVLALYFTLFISVFLLYCFVKLKNREVLLYFVQGVFFVSILVLPNILLFLEHYSMDYLVYRDNYVTSFGLIQENILSFRDLLFPSSSYDWTIPFYISFPVFISFFYSLYIAYKTSNFRMFILGILGICLLFVVSCDSFWKLLPEVFYVIQFPWRLLSILSILIALIAPLCLEKINRRCFFFLVVLFLVLQFPLVYKLSHRIYHYDYSVVDLEDGTGNLQEYYPNNYLEDFLYYRNKSGIDILNGNGNVLVLENNYEENRLIFQIQNSNNVELEFPKIYYKGYRLWNDENKDLEVYKCSSGLLCVSDLQDGVYTLEYTGTLCYRLFCFFRFIFLIWLLFKFSLFCFRKWNC